MKVKIARIKAGLTIKQLCEIVHISPNKLIRVEKGDYSNLTKSDMENIASALNCTVQELFFDDAK